MRILFIGSVVFSRNALEKILELKGNVVSVITKAQAGINSDFVDLSVVANSHGVPVKHVKDINHPNNIAWIKEQKPDVILCFGWSNLLGKEILNVAPLGVVGYHPALLPHNRGRHPLIWAKFLGLEKTGSTFFFMDEGADTGDILSQVEIPVEPEDDVNVIYEKMIVVALRQIEDFLPKLETGNFTRIPQRHVEGNSWRKRGVHDGLIDFRMSTAAICNLVRALTKPYVGAHCRHMSKNVTVWKVMPGTCTQHNLEPGKVLQVRNRDVEVKTYDGSVVLIEHEFELLPAAGEYLYNY